MYQQETITKELHLQLSDEDLAQFEPVSYTHLQRTYLMENYSDCLCHDCLKAVKDSFYACEINPRYNKKRCV